MYRFVMSKEQIMILTSLKEDELDKLEIRPNVYKVWGAEFIVPQYINVYKEKLMPKYE